MATIYLETECYTETAREPYTDDSWDRGDTSTEWTFRDFTSTRNHTFTYDYESCEVEELPNPGDALYAVVAIWSDGDSFGWDRNRRAEVFFVTRDKNEAHRVKDLLLEEKRPDGTLYTKYELPWHGYFESLTSIDVHEGIFVA